MIHLYISHSNTDDMLDTGRILSGWNTLAPNIPLIEDVSWWLAILNYELRHANRSFLISRIVSRIIKLISIEIREQLTRVINENNK